MNRGHLCQRYVKNYGKVHESSRISTVKSSQKVVKTGFRDYSNPTTLWRSHKKRTLAGLYRIENGFLYFTILTMNAAENIKFIHDRMPVILPHILDNEWITPNSKAEVIVAEALTDMVFEKNGCLL